MYFEQSGYFPYPPQSRDDYDSQVRELERIQKIHTELLVNQGIVGRIIENLSPIQKRKMFVEDATVAATVSVHEVDTKCPSWSSAELWVHVSVAEPNPLGGMNTSPLDTQTVGLIEDGTPIVRKSNDSYFTDADARFVSGIVESLHMERVFGTLPHLSPECHYIKELFGRSHGDRPTHNID